MQVKSPSIFSEVFHEVDKVKFPDLIYYDVDIPLHLRYAAEFNVFPLAYCKVSVKSNGKLANI